jgi:hypothetical protein
MKMSEEISRGLFVAGALTLILSAATLALPRPKGAATAAAFEADKGTFTILVDGKPAGKEEFQMSADGPNWVLRGTSELPAANAATRVTGTLQLRADGTPLQYEWSTAGDAKASCVVTFEGRTASIEPHLPGAYPYTQQLTFSSQPVVVLDNNLYDQYAVLAHLYDWSKKGVQTFSVIVPQEITGGTVTVESQGSRDVNGKRLESLQIKTEGNELNLLLDGQRLVRISVPSAKAEIVRE